MESTWKGVKESLTPRCSSGRQPLAAGCSKRSQLGKKAASEAKASDLHSPHMPSPLTWTYSIASLTGREVWSQATTVLPCASYSRTTTASGLSSAFGGHSRQEFRPTGPGASHPAPWGTARCRRWRPSGSARVHVPSQPATVQC